MNEHIAEGIRLNLEPEGFHVRHVANGLQAIEAIMEDQPDLVILDVMLPGASGFEVCDSVRSRGSHVPIMFLTVRDSEDARIKGLELGGDDYMTKPFSVRELIQRIRAILRRGQWYKQTPVEGPVFHFGANKVNFESYTASTAGGDVTLTQKECMVFKLLVENQGKVVSRDVILEKVWGYDRYPSTRTIDNLILRLRKYFEQDPKHPQYLHSLYGAGYKFILD
jgi:two-component system alkaline phosphatase synthesis response regulator PhoP